MSLNHLTSRYARQAAAMMDRVTTLAARTGLEYHLDRSWSERTGDAHCLLHLAARERAQDAGLDEAKVRAGLQSDACADAVARDLEQARAYGITRVPFFVFDDRLAVSGAQPREVFEQPLKQA